MNTSHQYTLSSTSHEDNAHIQDLQEFEQEVSDGQTTQKVSAEYIRALINQDKSVHQKRQHARRGAQEEE